MIVQSFTGYEAGGCTRVGNEGDYVMMPLGQTLFGGAHEAGFKAHAIGKVGKFFATRTSRMS